MKINYKFRNDKSYYTRLQIIYSGNKASSLKLGSLNKNLQRPTSRSQLSLPAINKIMNKREEDIYKGRLQSIVKRKNLYSPSLEQERLNSSLKSLRRPIINMKESSIFNLKYKQRLYNA